MPNDPNAFAEMVALTIKAALTPVLERVAGLEAQVKQALAVEQNMTTLRDRVVAIEVKAAVPMTPPESATVDLTPVMERLASADTRLARLAAVELTVGELRDRLLTIETKSALPVEHPAQGLDAPHVELLVHSALQPLQKSMAALQERIAVAEVRPLLPGPPGKDGLNGKDGERGKDGAPGKDGLAGLSFEGVYQEGKSYDAGNLVTWAGSSWHCNEPTTTKPGEGSKAWTLMVKRGRDGRDGKDAETTPVVSIGRPS